VAATIQAVVDTPADTANTIEEHPFPILTNRPPIEKSVFSSNEMNLDLIAISATQAEGLLDVDARQIVVKDVKGMSAILEKS
jgi:hypothetical protein